MQLLVIINNEVTRRAIKPVLDLLIANGIDPKILENPYCNGFMSAYSKNFVNLAFATKFKWDFIIASNPIDEHQFKGRRMVIHHGSMFGNSSWSLKSAYHSDVYFGLSPHELSYLKHHLKENFDSKKFIPAGNPANDHLVDLNKQNSILRTKKRSMLGLNDQKTILLSSHWTSLGNLRKFGTGLLDAVSWNYPDHQIICTCHPTLLKNPKAEFLIDKKIETPNFNADWIFKSIQRLKEKNTNVHLFFNDAKPTDLLYVSDIFVGDNSSFLAEASYFQIPLIANTDGAYFDKVVQNIVSTAVAEFSSIEQLIENLHFAVHTDNVKYGENIKNLFLYNIGSSANTIYETIVNYK